MRVKPLWTPSKKSIAEANITDFLRWLKKTQALDFDSYEALWQWSATDLETFWSLLTDYLQLEFKTPYQKVANPLAMPGVKWFSGASLNYTEQLFKNKNSDFPAIIEKTEIRPIREISWDQLHTDVAATSYYLRLNDIEKGDCVVGFMPNLYETVVAFLAVVSLGAIWSSCSPDFGSESVVERFKQIKPKLLFAVDGYSYGGKRFDRTQTIKNICTQITSIKQLVILKYIDKHRDLQTDFDQAVSFQQVLSHTSETIDYQMVEFNDPLWVLYSSGTTGRPKAITHSQGGIVLEHLKYLKLHSDIHPGSRFFWYSTTGWMMWNFVMGSLLAGGTALLYDGSPAFPDMDVLWAFAEEAKIETFGTSAAYIMACKKEGLTPQKNHDLSALKSIGSTGSPLPISGFEWCYENIKKDLWLNSVSGGTDICSVFTGGLPTLPVYPGEIQCRALGAKVEAYDDSGKPVIGQVGEMVIENPMPSMPVFFWNDHNNERYKASYFEMFPGIWRHGDWLEITPRGGAIITGRSDATLNRGGIRIGTAEIYSAIEKIPAISDSLIVGMELDEGDYYLPLFIVLKSGYELNQTVKNEIKTIIRKQFSPRHVPDDIFSIASIPYTLSGKKMETPVKKYLQGGQIDKVVNKDAMRNPDSFDFFVAFRTSNPKLK